MAEIFANTLKRASVQGRQPGRQAAQWFRDQASTVSRVNINEIMKRGEQMNRMPQNAVGKMFLFNYDPKHKATLPFYDRFPLIFMVDSIQGGFMGINMHYLPHGLRARLMDALYETVSDPVLTDKSRLKIDYHMMKQASKLRYFKPCLKRYLNTHVRSKLIVVPPEEWDIALFMPLERFSKARNQNVWTDSKRKINAV